MAHNTHTVKSVATLTYTLALLLVFIAAADHRTLRPTRIQVTHLVPRIGIFLNEVKAQGIGGFLMQK